MKRSEINQYINEAKSFMNAHQFMLPVWTGWTPQEWNDRKAECDYIRERFLGWDLTDFGWGDFLKTGLTLITLRNGSLQKKDKPYCEKIMFVRNGQVTPTHFHWQKTEDIINRGGGDLCMRLWKADRNSEELKDENLSVYIDGICTHIIAGEKIGIKPGRSICYEPYLYHTFWAENGHCLVGEVSTVNDDINDNRFLIPKGRFPQIEEDVPAAYLLCNEYPKAE